MRYHGHEIEIERVDGGYAYGIDDEPLFGCYRTAGEARAAARGDIDGSLMCEAAERRYQAQIDAACGY